MATAGIPTPPRERPGTEEFDVVVVGGGGSGLAAAITAAENGARVAMLEKATSLRGSTGRSIGSIAAAGTSEQHALGVADTPQEHAEDYLKIAGSYADREDRELVRLLTENVTETYSWLKGLGMVFFGPVPDPGHRHPRLHNILPTSESYIHHLAKRANAVGVAIALNTGAESLVQDPRGRVVGVRTLDGDGRQRTFSARNAVVLASGDFSNSPALKKEFISDEVADYVAVNPFAQGDAQRMARALGAQVVGGEVFDVPSLRFMPPPSEGLYGLLQKLPPGKMLTTPIRWGLANLPQPVIRSLVMGFVTTYLSPDVSMFANGAILIDADGQLCSDSSEPIPIVTARLGERGGYLVGDRDLYDRYSREPHHVATAPGLAYAYMPDFKRSRRDIYHEAGTVARARRSHRCACPRPPGVGRPGLRRVRARGGPQPRAVLCHGTSAVPARADQRRAAGVALLGGARRGRSADSRLVRGGQRRARRDPAHGVRPPPWLGLHIRPDRRSQRGPLPEPDPPVSTAKERSHP